MDSFARTKLLLSRQLQKKAICVLFSCLLLARPCSASGPPPFIFVQPSDNAVPILGSATFRVSAFSFTTMTYQWRENGTNILGATQNTFTISPVQAGSAGVYSVQVINGGGSVNSRNATLTVIAPPGITTQPQSQAVAKNNNVSFLVVASGGTLSYQWSLNGTPLTGATSSALALNKVRSNDAGSYTVVVTNSLGSVTSVVATLTVDAPPFITTQPQSQTEVAGQNASFSVAAIG